MRSVSCRDVFTHHALPFTFHALRTTLSSMPPVYLDHQAATPVLPEALEAMRPFFSEHFGNASSLHSHGLRARDALAKAREQTAALIGAESPEDIIFTSDVPWR